MTKYILIITSQSEKTLPWREREQIVRDFCENVESALTDTEVRFTTYDDLLFSVKGDQLHVFDERNQMDLKDVHLVQFKNWVYESEEAPTVAFYLDLHHVPYFNSEVALPTANGKLSQMVRLSQENIPVPPTFYARKRQLLRIFESQELPMDFSLPLVMKATNGSRGDDNYLIKTFQEALDVLVSADKETEFVLQPFIPNDGDYRFLFVGLEKQPLVFHRKAAGDSHLNNTSKGGSGSFIDLKDVPSDHIDYARRACQVLRREIGGADILVNKETGKAYILEVNGTPALASGFGVDVKTKYFVEFVAEMLAQEEEE